MSRFSTLLVPLTALLAACSPVSALTTSTAHAGGSCGFIQNTDLRNYCSNDCGFIQNADLRNFCSGSTGFIQNADLRSFGRKDCGFIQDADLRQLCQVGRPYPGVR